MEHWVNLVVLSLQNLFSRYRFPMIAHQWNGLFKLLMYELRLLFALNHSLLAVVLLLITTVIAVAEFTTDLPGGAWLDHMRYIVKIST